MNMREKLARAIYDSEGNQVQEPGQKWRPMRLDEEPAEDQQRYYEAADAVLDALMEPTEGMQEEGFKQYGSGAYDVSSPEVVFTSMIRAAKEGK